MKILSLTKSSLCLALAAGLTGSTITRLDGQQLAQQIQPAAPDIGFASEVQAEEVTPLMRGPLHEAFAEQFSQSPEPSEVIGKEPPPAIEELPPEYKPDGDNIQWIPGYWGWDVETNDFIWVTGLWRNVPPDQQWIPGYWTNVDSGWLWISGFWTSVATQELVYLPLPPAPVESGPSSPPPGDNYFYRPGNWIYLDGEYVWQAGFWAPGQQDWVWVPARYVWTPSGAIYRTGYWDYEVVQRGTVFCPVVFQPSYRQAFRPTYVVEIGPTWFANLFVAPQRNHYYFGNYYAYQGNTPIYPWVDYQRPARGFDPLFSYYAHQSRNVNWLTQVTRIQQQIAITPSLQSQRTVFAQMESLSRLQGTQPGYSLRAAQLQSLVRGNTGGFESPFRFTSLDQASRRRAQSAIAPSRQFVEQRRELERDSSPDSRQRSDREDRRGRDEAADGRGNNRPQDVADRDGKPAKSFRDIKRLSLKPEAAQTQPGVVTPRLEVATGPQTNPANRNQTPDGQLDRANPRTRSPERNVLESQNAAVTENNANRGRGNANNKIPRNDTAATEQQPRQDNMRDNPRGANGNRVPSDVSNQGRAPNAVPPALNRPDAPPTLPFPNPGKPNEVGKPSPDKAPRGNGNPAARPNAEKPAKPMDVKPSDVKPSLPQPGGTVGPALPAAPAKPNAKLPPQQPGSATKDRVPELRLPNVPGVDPAKQPQAAPRTEPDTRRTIDGLLLPGATIPNRPNMSQGAPTPGTVPPAQADRAPSNRGNTNRESGERSRQIRGNGNQAESRLPQSAPTLRPGDADRNSVQGERLRPQQTLRPQLPDAPAVSPVRPQDAAPAVRPAPPQSQPQPPAARPVPPQSRPQPPTARGAQTDQRPEVKPPAARGKAEANRRPSRTASEQSKPQPVEPTQPNPKPK